MKRPVLALVFTVLTGIVAAQDASIEPTAPGDTLRDADGVFALELTVEPLAGQTLQAGEFEVEFLGAAPAGAPLGDDVFSDGFESPAGAPP
jgi:hypothetical protein